jgi:hypothetical protein
VLVQVLVLVLALVPVLGLRRKPLALGLRQV